MAMKRKNLSKLAVTLKARGVNRSARTSNTIVDGNDKAKDSPGLSVGKRKLALSLDGSTIIGLLLSRGASSSSDCLALADKALAINSLNSVTFAASLLSGCNVQIAKASKKDLILDKTTANLCHIRRRKKGTRRIGSCRALSNCTNIIVNNNRALAIGLTKTPNRSSKRKTGVGGLVKTANDDLIIGGAKSNATIIVLGGGRVAAKRSSVSPTNRSAIVNNDVAKNGGITFVGRKAKALAIKKAVSIRALTLHRKGVILGNTSGALSALALRKNNLAVGNGTRIKAVANARTKNSLAVRKALGLAKANRVGSNSVAKANALHVRRKTRLTLNKRTQLSKASIATSNALALAKARSNAVDDLSNDNALSVGKNHLSVSSTAASSKAFSNALTNDNALSVSKRTARCLRANGGSCSLTIHSKNILILGNTTSTPALGCGDVATKGGNALHVRTAKSTRNDTGAALGIRGVAFRGNSAARLVCGFGRSTPFNTPVLATNAVAIRSKTNFLLSGVRKGTTVGTKDSLRSIILVDTANDVDNLRSKRDLTTQVSNLFTICCRSTALDHSKGSVLLGTALQRRGLFTSTTSA